MPAVHRHSDLRQCGATTTVIGQSTCYVNNLLWAVEGDTNTHGAGGLIPSGTTCFINSKPVIVHKADSANPDNLCPPLGQPHCNPKTAKGSGDTYCYGGAGGAMGNGFDGGAFD